MQIRFSSRVQVSLHRWGRGRQNFGAKARGTSWPIASTLTLLLPLVMGGPVLAQRPNGRPLATVDGVAIGDDEVDKVVGSVLWPLEDRLYRVQLDRREEAAAY